MQRCTRPGRGACGERRDGADAVSAVCVGHEIFSCGRSEIDKGDDGDDVDGTVVDGGWDCERD